MRLFLTLLICTTAYLSYAQPGKSIVIVAGEERILVPSIEKILDTMSYNNRQVFDRVTNINEISSNIKNEKELSGVVHYLTNRNIVLSSDNQQTYNALLKKITDFTYLLNVHINKINTLLEIQLYLYETSTLKEYKEASGADLILPSNGMQKAKYYSSFIVDLTKDSYNDQIYYQVKKMLPNYNYAPQAVITNELLRQPVYYLATEDTLRLSALNSRDREIKNDQLKFEWSSVNFSGRTKSDSGTHAIISTKRDFNFSLRRPGAVKIFLRVYDGASFSAPDSVTVFVNKRPSINVEDAEIKNYHYQSAFQKLRPSPVFYAIEAENYDKNPNSLHVEQLVTDSALLRGRHNRGLFASLYRQMAVFHLRDIFWGRDETIKFNIDSSKYGYSLTLNVDPLKDAKASFKVVAVSHHLESNRLNLKYINKAYGSTAFTLSLQNEKFALLGDSGRRSQIISHRQFLRFGLTLNLFSPDGITGDGLMGTLTFKMPKTTSNEVYLTNSPLEASLYFRKSLPIPIAFGLYGRYVWVHRQEQLTPTTYTVNGYSYLDYGVQLGFDIHPLKEWPVAFSYFYGFPINSLKLGSDVIGDNWGSFSVRYYFGSFN